MRTERVMQAVKAFAGWLLRLTAATACLAGAGVFLGPSEAELSIPQHCPVCKETR